MLKKQNFQLEVKAKRMVEHTFQVTGNNKRCPKKYRFTIVNRAQELSLNIYKHIEEANELNAGDEKELKIRILLETEIISECKTLLFLIEISEKAESIALNARQAQAWAAIVVEVKAMTASWRRSDQERERRIKGK